MKANQSLSVGYARVDITPEESVPLAGYGNSMQRLSQGVLDPLYATCIAITDSDGHSVLLCTVDLINTVDSYCIPARDAISKKYGISREDQDAFAVQSQQRAARAIENGIFRDEIVPVSVPARKGEPIVFDVDEFPKASTTMESLSRLKPVFRKDGKGSVTAGNACGRNDGAAGVILMSGEKAGELGVKPLARIIGQASAGVDPRYMGIGPIDATKKALAEAGLTIGDIGRVELNEAFAAQSLACIRELGLDEGIVNVNGGAIALGHPLGATGARIITTLLYEMMRSDVKYGLATLCVGGGMGCATVLEKL